MVVIKSPFSSRRFSVPEYELKDDFIYNNSRTKEKKSQNVFNNEGMTNTKMWNWNTWSTKKDEFRDAIIKPKYLDESRIRMIKWRKPRKWYNY